MRTFKGTLPASVRASVFKIEASAADTLT